MPKFNSPVELDKYRKKLQTKKKSDRTVITICGGTGCLSAHRQELFEAFQQEIEKQKLLNVYQRLGCEINEQKTRA